MTTSGPFQLTGSSSEGRSAANHFRHDNQLQDFDVMWQIGHIETVDQLVAIDNVPGFVKIKWSPNILQAQGTLPEENSFVNGFKLKENMLEFVHANPNLLNETVKQHSYTGDERTASVARSTTLNYTQTARHFHAALNYVEYVLLSQPPNEEKMKNFKQLCEADT
ncbi:unnamed protein product [Didymodactylos carnosus]|uniref:Uncharacterized protein n=1 Tax=Didymodactylos carnosus TaxID=1234261 RepID=A0A8S2J9N9_9BILA|nr:unnamed protein product [Didymodactylos carnosus]CAF3790188.1 unnamed protein product [Didymodactylos carnosus]